MDDFQVSTLNDTRNEYSALLVSKITPYIIQGIYSIFKEAVRLCQDNDEQEKYLMTFQNFLGRVPKWNPEIINQETERIMRQSNCNYLEDLLTCVHVTQLKLLTSIRVGTKQKKIDIDIPKLNDFIHRVYIDVARRIYKNVYLFEFDAPPLQKQKNMRECELIVKESILNVIRENMPVETILRTYLDETVEDDVEEVREEVREEVVETQDEAPETQNDNTIEEVDTNETVKEETNQMPIQEETVHIEPQPEPEPEVPTFTNTTLIQTPIQESIQAPPPPMPLQREEQTYEPPKTASPVITDIDTDYESDGFVPLKIMSEEQQGGNLISDLDIETIDSGMNLVDDNLLEEIEILA